MLFLCTVLGFFPFQIHLSYLPILSISSVEHFVWTSIPLDKKKMAVSFFPPLVIIFFKNSTQVTLCANMREKHGLFFFFFYLFSLSHASTAYFISCPSPVLFFCSWQCLYIKCSNKMQLHLTKKCLKNVTLLSAFLLHSPSAPSSWLLFTFTVTSLTPFSCLLRQNLIGKWEVFKICLCQPTVVSDFYVNSWLK